MERGFALRPAGRALLLALILHLPGLAAHGQTTVPADQPATPQPATPSPPAGPAPQPDAVATPPATAPAIASTTGGLSKSKTAGSSSGTKSISLTPSGASAIDYAAWDQLAQRAENAVADGATTSNSGLELLRGQLADWRSKLQAAQNANASRIQSQRDQINALGPAPAEGATEAEDIAARRKALTEQLQKLEAPGRTAEEAYRRANGLIQEIDRELRVRQTQQLLKLWPTPANPANWPAALTEVGTAVTALGKELLANWGRDARRTELVATLPLTLGLLLLALLLIFRGRQWIERFANWLGGGAESAHWRRVWSFLVSLGQIVVPTVGVFLISMAAMITGMPGLLGKEVLSVLPFAGFMLFASYWLAGRIFPKGDCAAGPFNLPAQVCAEGRLHTTTIGAIQGLELLRQTLLPPARSSEAAMPVLALPLLLVMALLLWRMGHLLNRHVAQSTGTEEAASFRDKMVRIVGKALIALAIIGPLLAVVGYTTAANAIVFRAAASLGLAGMLLVLVQLIGQIWQAALRTDEPGLGLFPVLAGFLLSLASLPLFSLVWGARVQDLSELWNRFTQGFMLGETRISPSNLLYFLILFLIGLGATRLFQGALKASILPKTKLDQGGRNAVVSGVGYIGIFLAGLIAVSAAGINLAGLAIVASALSLGIGFGLQNIVQNFVSGIILLIERPVSEGDWIEVSGVSGTVKNISVRSTRIQTFDRSDVIVPNGDLVSRQVTNWTRFSLTGRVIVPVAVKFANDTRHVAEILQSIAEAQPLALLNPAPSVLIVGVTADAVNFEVRVLIRDVNFSNNVKTEIYHEIMQRFHEEGIVLAGAPSAGTSRVEDVATVLEAIQAVTPEQLSRLRPEKEPAPQSVRRDRRLAAEIGAEGPPDHATDSETER